MLQQSPKMYNPVGEGNDASRVEDSGFLWIGVFVAASAITTVILTTMHLTFHYPMSLGALWWYFLGTGIWSLIALVLISVFASQRMQDAGKTGSQLRPRHYAASMMLVEKFFAYSALTVAVYAAFHYNQVNTAAFDNYGSDSWLTETNALKFGLYLWTSLLIGLGGGMATVAAIIQWSKSEVFPDTTPRG